MAAAPVGESTGLEIGATGKRMSLSKGSMTVRPIGIWLLGFGYFVFYIPYSGLTKALSGGLLPGLEGPISGFELLPATAVGALLGMPIFLGLSGWWRHARPRRWRGLTIPWAGRETLLSAVATAAIIGSTTLNYTFAGVSIILALLLMRGGVLILSPIVDALSWRRVGWYSWTALSISLTAVVLALADLTSYQMTALAALNLAVYLTGYCVRFQIMSRQAKVDHEAVNRRYFVEEHMLATPALLLMVGLSALLVPGQVGIDLRAGFTTFLFSPAAVPALIIGLLYECLFIFGSMIYLHRREFTYCVPVNRASSLLSGLVASLALVGLLGYPPPSRTALVSFGLILLALAVLALGPRLERRSVAAARRLFLFICDSNTQRSPMAERICTAEIAARLGIPETRLEEAGLRVASAGLDPTPGSTMHPLAAHALRRLGLDPRPHASRPVDDGLVEEADAIYCIDERQRQTLLRRIPAAAGKTRVLDPEADLHHGEHTVEQLEAAGRRLRELLRGELGRLSLSAAPAGSAPPPAS